MAREVEDKVRPQADMTLTGNEAIAHGARLSRVEATFFMPIGPSDEVGETMGQFYARGELEGTMVELEGEDANFAGLAAIAQSGVRAMFCTNSAGVKKGLPCIAGDAFSRIPLLLPMPHRHIGGGGGILADWGDIVILRDMAWILIQAESSQECLDLVPQAWKIAEHPDVSLPVAIGYEGWEISHSDERCFVPTPEDMDEFLPPRPNRNTLLRRGDWREGVTHPTGRNIRSGGVPELRYSLYQTLDRARELLKQGDEEYGKLFGRRWGGAIDDSLCKDAEVVFVTMASMLPTCRVAVEIARQLGISAGLLKLRMLNPFPGSEVVEALKGAKVVITLDRHESAVIYHHIRSKMFSLSPRPQVLGRVVGLGGETVSIEDMMAIFEEGRQAAQGEAVPELGWLLKGLASGEGIFNHPI